MRGLVSFHAVDPEIVDGIVAPLIDGGRIAPDGFLDQAIRFRRNGWHASRFVQALAEALRTEEPPAATDGGGWVGRMRTGIERLRQRPDPRAEALRAAVEPDVHLEGRPFLITEGSADRVASLVDEYVAARDGDAVDALAREQLARLGAEAIRGLEPAAGADLEPDFNYRRDVLDRLRVLFDLPRAARADDVWRPPGETPRPASAVLATELAWHVMAAHALVRPFWIARDVDGLETVARAAGVPAPGVLVPAARLVAPALREFPGLREALRTEISGPRQVGAFVAPADVPELVSFLAAHGARIIQAAARHGEGTRCAALLRKIRECATWAESHGRGYVEAIGIVPSYLDPAIADGPDRA